MKKILFLCLCLFVLIAGIAEARELKFEWQQEYAPDLAGFQLYYSGVSGSGYQPVAKFDFTGQQETYTGTADIGGVTGDVFFILRSFDADGNYSDPSNEATINFDPPSAPLNFKLILEISE